MGAWNKIALNVTKFLREISFIKLSCKIHTIFTQKILFLYFHISTKETG